VDLMPNLPTRHHRIRHHGRFTNPIAQSQEIDVARENQLAAAERELETAIREHRAIGLAAAGARYHVGWRQLVAWANDGNLFVGHV
jgi:hypothetical protein